MENLKKFFGTVDRFEDDFAVIIVDDDSDSFQIDVPRDYLNLENLSEGSIISFNLIGNALFNVKNEDVETSSQIEEVDSILESLKKGSGSSFKD